jgi:hypothetical protein
MGVDSLLHFAENELQIGALIFMAVVYGLKIRWILGFPAARDRQAPARNPGRSARKGAWLSLLQIAMPWAMGSTRQHPLLYAQFALFHLAVAASIAMSFLIPYAPGTIAGNPNAVCLQCEIYFRDPCRFREFGQRNCFYQRHQTEEQAVA